MIMPRIPFLYPKNVTTLNLPSKTPCNLKTKVSLQEKSYCIPNSAYSNQYLSCLFPLCLPNNTGSHVNTFTSKRALQKTDPLKLERQMHFSAFNQSSKDESVSTEPVSIDSIGTWGDSNFELPLEIEASIEHGKPIPHIVASNVGCGSSLGKRTYQEDRYFIQNLNGSILCCAVFDGHGGSECSSFCTDNLETVLQNNMESSNDLESLLHHSILDLNSLYSQWSDENKKGARSGTTCTVCLLKDGVELVVGHVGDSRALLCRRGGPRRLTNDHCPSNLAERKRVEQSGGAVITDNIGRHMVNGVLSMSRSIGDLHLKKFGVTALPDTRKIMIKHGHDAFLLLTTDGINFVLNDEEICGVVNHAQDPQNAATSLLEHALGMSSEDNLTALVVPLGSWGNFAKSSASMFYSFGIGRDMSKSSRFG